MFSKWFTANEFVIVSMALSQEIWHSSELRIGWRNFFLLKVNFATDFQWWKTLFYEHQRHWRHVNLLAFFRLKRIGVDLVFFYIFPLNTAITTNSSIRFGFFFIIHILQQLINGLCQLISFTFCFFRFSSLPFSFSLFPKWISAKRVYLVVWKSYGAYRLNIFR